MHSLRRLETSRPALLELHWVITGFDIISQLQNASNAFRTYIEEGLAEMEKNAAAGRTLSSVPMSMPPPVALNLISCD
ncbi:hypothetical protein MKW98_013895 [Papaver atlanticum]|uniref:Uncharacterized protein n=1 Tax=Papaver atlanticum TaxID=357466 RepID=A0AAD4SDB8_9MAGN|nr:hypothetical protein MKW98_013895 [Papaver atlanticum]